MLSFDSYDPDRVPSAKLATHGLQIVLGFIAWAMEIAVFANDKAEVTGQIGWTFGTFFLSIFAWIYQLMTPRWQRTRKFADPRAMLTVDAVFLVISLSAFATQAAYNTSGKCNPVCGISKGIVAIGVFSTLLWGAALAISFFTLRYYEFHGSLPGYDKRPIKSGDGNIDPHKADFSMAPHDDEAYAPVNMDERDPGRGDEYASGAYGGSGVTYSNPQDAYDEGDNTGAHGGYVGGSGGTAYNAGNSDTSHSPSPYGGPASTGYGGASHQTDYSAPGAGYVAPTATDTFEDGPAQFPAANYDRTLR